VAGSRPKAEFHFYDGEIVVMDAPSLLDPAAQSLKLSDFTGVTDVAREARRGMRRGGTSSTADRGALSDADLEKLLAAWVDR
jgi:hypothetical protein